MTISELQVLVCGDRIGWRKETRRVIIFTTDQSFHIALDGKLGGLVRPNDGKCHLDNRGFYSKSTVLDYPSIGQVNALAQEHRASIIWAVTEDQIDLYASITGIVEGSFAGIISKDSSNIVELVKRQYEMITTTVRVNVNSSSNCPAKLIPECKQQEADGEEGKKLPTTAECKNVELGTPVEFTLEVKPKTCSPETVWVQPVGMVDRLLVEVEPVCECPCRRTDDDLTPEEERCQSERCNGHGHLVCGECKCCGDYYGPGCECLRSAAAAEEEQFDPDPDAACRPANASLWTPPCSGRGECVCGKCQCVHIREGLVISGKFCEKVKKTN